MKQSAPSAVAARLPPDAHIGRVRLRVASLERALGFYRDLLGFCVTGDDGANVALAAGDDADADRPAPSDKTTRPRELVVLQETPGIARRPQRPVTTGLYHVALLVPSRRALGRALLALGAKGYPLRGMSDHAVSESLYLDDPDGNGLEIYADRPRSAWPVRDGMIQMTIDPIDVDGVLAAGRERPTPWKGLASETVVGHVHFTVSRLAPAVAFYRDVVGFDVTARLPMLEALSAGGYHHHLNLNTWAGEGAPPDSDRVAGLASWELVVPDAGARQAVAERLTTAGAAVSDVESSADRVMARDPDGIAFDIVGSS